MINPLEPLEIRNNLTSNLDPKLDLNPEDQTIDPEDKKHLLRVLRDQASFLSGRINEAQRAIKNSDDIMKECTKNKSINLQLKKHYEDLLSETTLRINSTLGYKS